jgi:hypothetical protein
VIKNWRVFLALAGVLMVVAWRLLWQRLQAGEIRIARFGKVDAVIGVLPKG